jgi:hypothetical protein
VKENAEALVAVNREIGLEVSADKTKYMVMPRDQNARRIHMWECIILPSRGWKTLNIWGKYITNKNFISQQIKSRLKSGNACYHLVQNVLSSRFLSKM